MQHLKNNLRDYLGKLLIQEKPNIFFIHIPKTGGQSIEHAIKLHYKTSTCKIDSIPSHRVSEIQGTGFRETLNFRENLALYEMLRGKKFIAGHIPFSVNTWQNFHQQYVYITVFRNPVKRYISNYFYNTHKASSHVRINDELEAFLASERGRSHGCQYIQYIGGTICEEFSYTSQKAIEIAKHNLAKFQVIGFLEDLDTFCSRFEERTGLSLKMPHFNKNPVPQPQIEPELLKEIERICQPDIELYEYAKTQV